MVLQCRFVIQRSFDYCVGGARIPAVASTQYDACSNGGILPFQAYALIAFSACITATTGVWNQKVREGRGLSGVSDGTSPCTRAERTRAAVPPKVIKGFDVPINLQNMILYSFGAAFALITFVYHRLTGVERIGLLEGYTFLSVCLVLSQAPTRPKTAAPRARR